MAETKKRLIANFMSLGFQQGITIVFSIIGVALFVKNFGIKRFWRFYINTNGHIVF